MHNRLEKDEAVSSAIRLPASASLVDLQLLTSDSRRMLKEGMDGATERSIS